VFKRSVLQHAAVLLPCLLGAVVSGCAEERDPINRVQPNAIPKEFFVGASLEDPGDDPEFLFRNYVVDGSASQSLVTIGEGSEVDRIRWEITEDLLIGRKAYQLVKGADDKGLPEKDPNGIVIAAYRIESHFDIRHEYNPATGEEYNVIVENTGDLPWQARTWMRIDWSQNLVEDNPLFLSMFLGRMFGDIKVTPVSYSPTDPGDKNAPHFEDNYFDITSKFQVAPEESSYWPGIPTCVVMGLFTGSASYECDAQEAVVRSSFMRLTEDTDFESLEISRAPGDIVGNPAQINEGGFLVGYSNTTQQGWDPGYGFTDALYRRFAHIHNIWQKSHIDATCGDNADLDNDGTADQCAPGVTGYAGNLGSQCDIYVGRCTIPYRDRQVKTVTYYVNPDMPAELQDTLDASGNPTDLGAAEDIFVSWNQLLSNSVGYAREVECRRTGGDRDACHAEVFEADKVMLSYGAWLVDKTKEPTPVLAMCHNPVRSYDVADCGEPGYQARLGDVRRNFMSYWPYASRAPYGGIGYWGADPLTGQIHGAGAMIMGRSATMAAAMQRDMIQVALGDRSIEDITNGVPAQNYAHQLQNGHSPKALSSEEISRRVASVDADHAYQTTMPNLPGGNVQQKYEAMVNMQKNTTPDVEWLNSADEEYEAVAGNLRGSLPEAQLVDGLWMTSVAGLAPWTDQADGVLDAVSPLRGLDPGALRAGHNRIRQLAAARGLCFGHNDAPVGGSADMTSLARYFGAKYPSEQYSPEERGKLIYDDLWKEAFKGIAIHEVGHSLGLLHNFASSWDSPNYHPGYWQLRTHEGASQASCEGQPRTGDTTDVATDGCMGPRYLDPTTDDESGLADEPRPSIDYYAQSSVMEYSLERFGETIGLGQYDAHAMNTLYGRVIETFEDADRGGATPEEQLALAPRMQTQLTEENRVTRADAPFAGQLFPKPTHYTDLGRMMRSYDAGRCRDATDAEKATAGWRLVHGKVCAPTPKDHAAWRDFEHGNVFAGWADATAPYLKTRADARSGGGKIRWMYRYGATFNSYFHTQASDAGADAFETTTNAIRKFDGMYPWQYFRRGNREYFSESLPFSTADRFFEQLRAYHWQAANSTAFYKTFGDANYEEIANSDHWHRPLLMANTEMFNAMARYILTPEPGDYGQLPSALQPVETTRPIYDADTNTVEFGIEAVDGRFVGQDFNSDPDGGGSWEYLHWMNHAGFGVEKTFAAMALADGRPVLSTISRENYLDGRGVSINFRNDMPLAVDRLIGGVLSEDWETVGMYVAPVGLSAAGAVPAMTNISVVDEEPSRPAGSLVLYPNVGYKQQLGVLIFAHVYSRTNGDISLSNKLRLWIDGQANEVNVPEAQQSRFYHPDSGYTYIARRYGSDAVDGKTFDAGIASRMLAHANALLTAAYEVEKDVDGNVVTDSFGTPVLVLDAEGQPIVTSSERLGQLTQYVGLMDAARQIAALVGYGPLD
jgi:hypothetical protein